MYEIWKVFFYIKIWTLRVVFPIDWAIQCFEKRSFSSCRVDLSVRLATCISESSDILFTLFLKLNLTIKYKFLVLKMYHAVWGDGRRHNHQVQSFLQLDRVWLEFKHLEQMFDLTTNSCRSAGDIWLNNLHFHRPWFPLQFWTTHFIRSELTAWARFLSLGDCWLWFFFGAVCHCPW